MDNVVDKLGDNFLRKVDNFILYSYSSYPHSYPHSFGDNFLSPIQLVRYTLKMQSAMEVRNRLIHKDQGIKLTT